jgi:DNA-binding CsgD family transcriptional regulator
MPDFSENKVSYSGPLSAEEANRLYYSVDTWEGMLLSLLTDGQSLNKAAVNIGKSIEETRAIMKSIQQKLNAKTQKETIEKWNQVRLYKTLS